MPCRPGSITHHHPVADQDTFVDVDTVANEMPSLSTRFSVTHNRVANQNAVADQDAVTNQDAVVYDYPIANQDPSVVIMPRPGRGRL